MSEIKTTRRVLLQGAGAAGIGFALTGCEHRDPFAPHKPHVPGSENWATGEERYVSTSCGQCDAGCGIRVRVVEGRAVKVEGNRASPVNRGGVGPRGVASPQSLYDPDRIRTPLQLVGPRGSGEWREIDWESAIALVAVRLQSLREAETPERVGIFCGYERGFMLELWKRFAESYGTPNQLDTRNLVNGATLKALSSMQGLDELPAYDWGNTRLVLSLGSGILDSSCQMLHFVRSRRQNVSGAERARLVHVGTALTRTAMNSDDFILVRPGTYAAFALGVAHILVRDELYDAEFVTEHSQGFSSWEDESGRKHIGFEDLLSEYAPERVSEICGIDPAKLESIALRMAKTRPCFVVGGVDELCGSNGVQTALAIHALNALLGSIDRPGGLIVQGTPPLDEWPEVELDDIAEAGLQRDPLAPADARSPWDTLPELDSPASRLDVVLLHDANPVYERANPEQWKQFLSKVPFIVSFASVFDETNSEFADLILPDHHWMERWEDAAEAPGQGRAVFGLRQPVVEPLYDTRATSDVLIALAAELGETVAAAFPWKDFQAAFLKRVVGLHNSKSGSIIESKGSSFLKQLYAEGVWYDDTYEFEQWDRSLRTESGRFEFFPMELWRALESRAQAEGVSIDELAATLGAGESADRLVLPDYRPLQSSGDATKFPLLLAPFRPSTFIERGSVGLPWLIELAPWKGRPIWGTEVELHPDTAARHGIGSGDIVRIESARGAIEARAHLNQSQHPEIVRVAQGAGHTAGNRYATGWGANVMSIIASDVFDPLGGSSPTQGTRVAIRKVTA